MSRSLGAAHAVLFYDCDDELTAALAHHLAGPLADGATAIVIATEAHRSALYDRLAEEGLDPLQLRLDDALWLLDAGDTLARFMTGGRVRRDAFHRVIGATVRAAGERGAPVLAFGEMVALLWDAGDVLGAIELEQLWNELGEELPFSLLCGYRSDSVAGPEHASALEHVCHLHSAILHPPAPPVRALELSAHFEPELAAPGDARRLAGEALSEWGGHPELLDDVLLVVSELASNAVRHAGTPFSVTVRCDAEGLAIVVEDSSLERPVLRHPGPHALFGRGLHLIGALATDWGVEPTRDGKAVWARLSA